MSDVFISYSRLDKEFVGKLRDALANEDQDIWIDWESIPASQAWWDEIKKGIARANNFVVVLSPNSMASPICQMEIEYARQLGKRIIPVLHIDYKRQEAITAIATRLADVSQDATRLIWGDRQPHSLFDGNDSELKHINYFFFRPEDNFDPRFVALFEVIRTDYAHKEQHTTLELRALEWQRRSRNTSFLLIGDELNTAQQWLNDSSDKNPKPTDLQSKYITTSSDMELARQDYLDGLQKQADEALQEANIAQIQADEAKAIADIETKRAVQQRSRAHTAIAIALMFIVLALGAGVFGVVQTNIANTQIAALAGIAPGATMGAIYKIQLTGWEPIEREIDGVMMVLVPAGCFEMGEYGNSDEQPLSEICIEESFWLDKTEVTQGQLEAKGGIKENENHFLGDNLPVENITWYEAEAYCREKRGGRLPTEAEWEFAARGTNRWRYPWGDTYNVALAIDKDDPIYGNISTAPVSSKPTNASWIGAVDMSGNVSEWVRSLYRNYPYDRYDGRESIISNENRVFRGGSWNHTEDFLHIVSRNQGDPNDWGNNIGFRCAFIDLNTISRETDDCHVMPKDNGYIEIHTGARKSREARSLIPSGESRQVRGYNNDSATLWYLLNMGENDPVELRDRYWVLASDGISVGKCSVDSLQYYPNSAVILPSPSTPLTPTPIAEVTITVANENIDYLRPVFRIDYVGPATAYIWSLYNNKENRNADSGIGSLSGITTNQEIYRVFGRNCTNTTWTLTVTILDVTKSATSNLC